MLIEVAESSLEYDRDKKIPRYAQYAIPEVWLVDLNNTFVDVYLKPTLHGFERVERFELGQQITSSLFPELLIKVDELFLR
ncbi:protein containing DUF820 [Candidatus Thiomargarita nelsonii]|uniref:Protein containing DUF820 n=1 Tax=Candidatus Thiomargarita nelsonii TaxID=1003181 RepID=A0A176S7E6_9GAMM|nr:protein containing DUF820 [Candidatus Thiomargarita nelsonii]